MVMQSRSVVPSDWGVKMRRVRREVSEGQPGTRDTGDASCLDGSDGFLGCVYMHLSNCRL